MFAIGEEGGTSLIPRGKVLRVDPGEMCELAAGAYFFHLQAVCEYHTVGKEFLVDRLIVFLPRFAVLGAFAGFDLHESVSCVG